MQSTIALERSIHLVKIQNTALIKTLVTQSCLTPCDPPGSSVHEIL